MSDMRKALIYLIGKRKLYPMPLKNFADFLSVIGYRTGKNFHKIREALSKGEVFLIWQNDRCQIYPVENMFDGARGMAQSEWFLDWLENPKQF